MKFTEHLGAHLTPEWRSQYIRYEQLKEVLYDGLEKMPSKDENPDSVIQSYFSKFEEQWFSYCNEELEKINTFFLEKIAEAGRKFTALKNELYVAGSLKVGPSLNTLVTSKKMTLAPKPSNNVKVKTKKKVSQLKFAFGEFYLSLILLQNYQQLNFTGFRKILKKHDKVLETANGAQYRQERIEIADFFTNKHVDELILETEDLYITELEDGNRSRAMNRLRVPPLQEEMRGNWVSCRVGFLSGIFLMLVSIATVAAFFTDHRGEFDIAIRIYRGIFLFVLVTFLLAINTWGWRKAGVNHVLIFELDPRDHLSYQQLLEVALLLGVLWAISLVVFMFGHVLGIGSYSPNLVLVSFMFLFTFNPFRICYYRARFWLLKVLFRIFTAPFQHVGFADFWLADQLNSLAVALLDLQFIICFYAHDWHVSNANEMICDGTLYGVRPFVACLPAWFRFAQCLRRYKDTRQAFPHLVNAGKYSTSFFVVAFSTLAKSDSLQRDRFFMAWIIAAIISTCYTFTWDIKMDWGLLDKKAGENKFLREETVYRSTVSQKEFNSLVFRFLWNGNDKVTRLSTYAPYDQGGLKMLDYDNMVKALRLSWLKRIVDPDYSGFWKSYLDNLLVNEGGLFLIQCNYDVNRLTISATFYRELLDWWSKLREVKDPENIYKYILWNNKEIKIDGKSVFYKHFFDNNIIYTTHLLYEMTNVESFNVVRDAGLKNSNFLVWTGLRQSVPSKLRSHIPTFENILDLENFKCRDYYHYLIKQKYERPNKWAKLREEFNLEDKQLSEAFVMPLRVANEPYLRSFQYKVLNSILYTNELLCKIGYVSNPNCSFCHQTIETISHIFFDCSFSTSFWNEVCDKILNKLKSCASLSLEYRQIILGFLKGEMDLQNYILILGKTYLWTCRCKETKPSFSHFERILLNKYQIEKYISFKSNNMNFFRKKWRMFEEMNLLNN